MFHPPPPPHNEELYELLSGPDIVKCIKFKRLRWAGHITRMDSSRIRKSAEGKISWKKTCGKTTSEMGRHAWDSPLLVNIVGWSRVERALRISGGEILKKPRPNAGCRAI
jgi:hypothetical protein